MKNIFNISLYVIIFFLVVSINIISIKKYFDIKKCIKLENIVAVNNISSFISFNKLIFDENMSNEILKKEDIEALNDNFLKEEAANHVDLDVENVQETINPNDSVISNTESNDIISDDVNNILFDGLTEIELINKIEKSLKNELSGTAINFVEYYKTKGLNPYLSVAIVLHETGCTWTCSNLVKQCFNYGGMKGGENKYKDTQYACYDSKEEGINAYLDMLYNNYYSKGLTTAELINPKYASSLEWASKINNYIDKIKNN